MNSRSPRIETTAYLSALFLAVGLRFVALGALPLTDSEAAYALQSFHVVHGLKPALSSNVAYVNLTALTFFIFGSTNFLARFWPALAGSALVLTPWLFRKWIRPRPALILSFFLAIDPALVAVSRTAGGSMLALAGFLLSVGFWLRGQTRLAGIFAALALLGGPSLWPGLLGLLLTWLIVQGFFSGTKDESMESSFEIHTTGDLTATQNNAPAQAPLVLPESSPTPEPSILVPLSSSSNYRLLITSAVAALFALSTLILLVPQGIGAWTASLPEYLLGWVRPSSVPLWQMLLAPIVYEPMAVLLALIALARGWTNGSKLLIPLSLWVVVSLLVAVFYPARQTADLVWTLLPLWTMSAIELNRHLQFVREDRIETLGVTAFTLILVTFAWLDFIALPWTYFPSAQGNLRLYMLVGAVILFIVSIVLVGYGWSERVARVGAAWGLAALFGFYTLGAAWGATGLRTADSVEFYQAGQSIQQADLLTLTVREISDWSVGSRDYLPVLIYGVDSPALVWALRFHDPQVVTVLDSSSSPALVITPPVQSLQLSAAYRGQDFNWRESPSWDAFSVYQLRWLTLRELPVYPETIVLWARDDLFIDAAHNP